MTSASCLPGLLETYTRCPSGGRPMCRPRFQAKSALIALSPRASGLVVLQLGDER